MEFEMQWDGNPNSIVDVKTIKLHIEVGDFQKKKTKLNSFHIYDILFDKLLVLSIIVN